MKKIILTAVAVISTLAATPAANAAGTAYGTEIRNSAGQAWVFCDSTQYGHQWFRYTPPSEASGGQIGGWEMGNLGWHYISGGKPVTRIAHSLAHGQQRCRDLLSGRYFDQSWTVLHYSHAFVVAEIKDTI
ncbi:MAG: hypothetical protein ACM3UO_00270 [Bacillota bacterium]